MPPHPALLEHCCATDIQMKPMATHAVCCCLGHLFNIFFTSVIRAPTHTHTHCNTHPCLRVNIRPPVGVNVIKLIESNNRNDDGVGIKTLIARLQAEQDAIRTEFDSKVAQIQTELDASVYVLML